jgi:hypothetical protein
MALTMPGRLTLVQTPPAIGESIRQEVQAPALGALRQRHRRPGAQGPFAPASTTHLQSFLAIEPAQLFVVHDDAFAPEQDMQPPIAEPSANGGQFAQPCPDRRVTEGWRCGWA